MGQAAEEAAEEVQALMVLLPFSLPQDKPGLLLLAEEVSALLPLFHQLLAGSLVFKVQEAQPQYLVEVVEELAEMVAEPPSREVEEVLVDQSEEPQEPLVQFHKHQLLPEVQAALEPLMEVQEVQEGLLLQPCHAHLGKL